MSINNDINRFWTCFEGGLFIDDFLKVDIKRPILKCFKTGWENSTIFGHHKNVLLASTTDIYKTYFCFIIQEELNYMQHKSGFRLNPKRMLTSVSYKKEMNE